MLHPAPGVSINLFSENSKGECDVYIRVSEPYS
nr:MAG TPA: hypothetical protein [Caudoviricetes sp.]